MLSTSLACCSPLGMNACIVGLVGLYTCRRLSPSIQRSTAIKELDIITCGYGKAVRSVERVADVSLNVVLAMLFPSQGKVKYMP